MMTERRKKSGNKHTATEVDNINNHDDRNRVPTDNSDASSPSKKSGKKRTATEVDDIYKHDDDHGSVQTARSDSSTPTIHTARTDASRITASMLTAWDKKIFDKDTAILQAYVKDELYYGVKFLYDPRSDLDTSQPIFQHFYKTCKDRLEGLKKYPGKEERDLYIRNLWNTATSERVQQDALSVKRSSVYTVMQNRFFCESIGAWSIFQWLLVLMSTHYCEYCIFRFM